MQKRPAGRPGASRFGAARGARRATRAGLPPTAARVDGGGAAGGVGCVGCEGWRRRRRSRRRRAAAAAGGGGGADEGGADEGGGADGGGAEAVEAGLWPVMSVASVFRFAIPPASWTSSHAPTATTAASTSPIHAQIVRNSLSTSTLINGEEEDQEAERGRDHRLGHGDADLGAEEPHDQPAHEEDREEAEHDSPEAVPRVQRRVGAEGLRDVAELSSDVLPGEEHVDEEQQAPDEHELRSAGECRESFHSARPFSLAMRSDCRANPPA